MQQLDDAKLKIGDAAVWTSQAAGSYTMKEGHVVALIGKNADARKLVPEGVPTSRIKFQATSVYPRYLVVVPHMRKDGSQNGFDYYAPLISNVDKQMAKTSK